MPSPLSASLHLDGLHKPKFVLLLRLKSHLSNLLVKKKKKKIAPRFLFSPIMLKHPDTIFAIVNVFLTLNPVPFSPK